MARLVWVTSSLVSEPAFRVKHHTAEASTRRRLDHRHARSGRKPTPPSATGDQLTSAAIAAVQKWPHRPNRSERALANLAGEFAANLAGEFANDGPDCVVVVVGLERQVEADEFMVLLDEFERLSA